METLNSRVITATDQVVSTDDVIVCNSATPIFLFVPRATGSSRRLIIRAYGAGSVRIVVPDTIEGTGYADLIQEKLLK